MTLRVLLAAETKGSQHSICEETLCVPSTDLHTEHYCATHLINYIKQYSKYVLTVANKNVLLTQMTLETKELTESQNKRLLHEFKQCTISYILYYVYNLYYGSVINTSSRYADVYMPQVYRIQNRNSEYNFISNLFSF